MKFGYTILYVPSVIASIDFFERAFDMQRRFMHEGGDYGELATGEHFGAQQFSQGLC
jgi:lactoylglutathione lyase